MTKVVTDERLRENEAILHHEQGVDLMPFNIGLSGDAAQQHHQPRDDQLTITFRLYNKINSGQQL